MANQPIKRRKAVGKRKDEYIRARVTVAQKGLFQQAADHAGIPLSSWIVERLLREARKETQED